MQNIAVLGHLRAFKGRIIIDKGRYMSKGWMELIGA